MIKIMAVLTVIISNLTHLQGQTSITIRDAQTNEKIPFASAGISTLHTDTTITVSSNLSGQINLKQEFLKDETQFVICVAGAGYKRIVDTLSVVPQVEIRLAPLSFKLEEVVITAQLDSLSITETVQKVAIISAEKIEDMGAVTLNEVLSNELNIRIEEDNVLGTGMTMQGISGENIKILVDGVPMVGRLDGNIDLSQINLSNVEQIEILQGPQSVSYGTNALAGTINIITKKEQSTNFDASIKGYYESIGKYNLNGRLGFKIKKHNISFHGGRNYFDGWNEEDKPFITPELTANNRTTLWNPKTQYFGGAAYGVQIKNWHLKYKFDAFSEKIVNRGTPILPYQNRAFDDYYYTDRIDNALLLNGNLGKGKSFRFVAAYNYYRRQKNTYQTDLTNLSQQIAAPSEQDTSKFNLMMSRGIFATAVDTNFINYQIGYEIDRETAIGKRIEQGEQSQGNYSLFGAAEVQVINALVISPALRLTYNTAFGSPVLPSVSGRFAKKEWVFRASVAKGFRAPSLKELYFEFNDINHNIYGNKDLQAESSINYTASVTWDKLKAKVPMETSFNVFYNDINNIITLVQMVSDPSRYHYVNLETYKTKGFNSDMTFVYPKLRVTVGGGMVYQYNILSESNDVSDFSHYPEVKCNASYKIKTLGLRLSYFYKYQGRSQNFTIDSNDDLSQNFMGAYSISDISLSKVLSKDRLRLMIGCKNLFNVTNVTANTAGGTHSASASSVSVGTGRSYFLSLEFKLTGKSKK